MEEIISHMKMKLIPFADDNDFHYQFADEANLFTSNYLFSRIV